jgi:hypothetical protein
MNYFGFVPPVLDQGTWVQFDAIPYGTLAQEKIYQQLAGPRTFIVFSKGEGQSTASLFDLKPRDTAMLLSISRIWVYSARDGFLTERGAVEAFRLDTLKIKVLSQAQAVEQYGSDYVNNALLAIGRHPFIRQMNLSS